MANNPYVNKVEYAGQTLMDLTGDTATPSDVLNGATFHDRSGTPQTGSLITHNVYDGLDSTSISDALSAKQGFVLNSKLSIIGTVVFGTSTGSVSVPSGTTPEEVGSITLGKGTWIIIGCCDWQSNANGYRQIAFGSGLNPSREISTTTMGTSSKETYQQVITIATYSESTTLKLYATQNSDSSLSAYPLIKAIRIA